MRQRHFWNIGKKGSYTVEAAIIFPIFILMWVPFLYLMRYCILYENLRAEVHQTAMVLSDTGYLFQRAGLKEIQDTAWREEEEAGTPETASVWLNHFGEAGRWIQGALSLCSRILEGGMDREIWQFTVNQAGQWITGQWLSDLRAEEEWIALGADQAPQLTYSEFFYTDSYGDDQICLIAYVDVHWSDPAGFFKERRIAVSTRIRAFTGLYAMAEADEDADSTGETPEQKVYYRIGNGKRYHTLDCYLIQKDIRTLEKKKAEAQGYQVCEDCGGGSDMVWVTPRGTRYHKKGCAHLFPAVHALTEAELRSGRYTPCRLCQGEQQWFS